MAGEVTVSDIFRRALELRQGTPNGDLKDLKRQIVSEFGGGPFPSTAFLTIPEYDNIVPEEDWTAGLPVVLRGIQTEDWEELAVGIHGRGEVDRAKRNLLPDLRAVVRIQFRHRVAGYVRDPDVAAVERRSPRVGEAVEAAGERSDPRS